MSKPKLEPIKTDPFNGIRIDTNSYNADDDEGLDSRETPKTVITDTPNVQGFNALKHSNPLSSCCMGMLQFLKHSLFKQNDDSAEDYSLKEQADNQNGYGTRQIKKNKS